VASLSNHEPQRSSFDRLRTSEQDSVRYEIEVGGRIRHVAVERAGDGFAVELDGRRWRIDASRVDGHTLSLILDNEVDRKDKAERAGSEVTVVPGQSAGQFTIQVGALPIAVTVNGRRHRAGSSDRAAAGPQLIAAPMPGKIVRVFVRPGDAVTARQPLVVVEAMKMENELRANRDGTVAEVHVREGLSVEAGAPLIVIQ
jgi:biotin carboxyl carrier protein